MSRKIELTSMVSKLHTDDLCSGDMCSGRRERNKLERRQAIIKIAKQEFLEQGYLATSMSAISAKLGGSKGTLWSYFPNKQALFAAVLDETISVYRAEMASVLQPAQDIRETLQAFCESFITKITSDMGLALKRLIVTEVVRDAALGEMFFEQAPRQTRQLVGQYLEGQMDKSLLRRADPLDAAHVLLSLCSGGSLQFMLWTNKPPEPFDIPAEARFVVDIFLRAYAPEAGQS
jgi:AcrR family transcriptional regulator